MATGRMTPPIVIVESSYPPMQVVPSRRPVDLGTLPVSKIRPSTSSPISLSGEPPLELPPTFRRIVNDIKIKDRALIEHRYQEFLEIESREASTPLQEGGQVKLSHPGRQEF